MNTSKPRLRPERNKFMGVSQVRNVVKELNGGVQRCGVNAHGQIIIKLPQGYICLPSRFTITNATSASKKYGLRLIYRSPSMQLVVKTSKPERLYREFIEMVKLVAPVDGLYRRTMRVVNAPKTRLNRPNDPAMLERIKCREEFHAQERLSPIHAIALYPTHPGDPDA